MVGRRPTIAHGGRGAGHTRSLEHSNFGNRPIAPCLERGPLACPPALDWTLCAGGIDLVNILGFLSNFMNRPLCSAMNRMVVLM